MDIKNITSRDNAIYKELKLLASSSQARRKAGRTLLDGIHLCEAYLQHVGKPMICVVSESARHHAEAGPIMALCAAANTQCIVLPDTLFHVLSQVEHGIDLLFVIATPQPQPSATLTHTAVLLDRLQDPGNMGSILRSAAAAGIREVYCSPGTTFAWSPKVLRAGMGAHFHLNIYENYDLHALAASAGNVAVIATSSHASHSIYALDLRSETAWIFGHEGQGVDPELLRHATHLAVIPHAGEIESLNVAACAAVCFFEQFRQRTSIK